VFDKESVKEINVTSRSTLSRDELFSIVSLSMLIDESLRNRKYSTSLDFSIDHSNNFESIHFFAILSIETNIFLKSPSIFCQIENEIVLSNILMELRHGKSLFVHLVACAQSEGDFVERRRDRSKLGQAPLQTHGCGQIVIEKDNDMVMMITIRRRRHYSPHCSDISVAFVLFCLVSRST
jgi:hypothetical protein